MAMLLMVGSSVLTSLTETAVRSPQNALANLNLASTYAFEEEGSAPPGVEPVKPRPPKEVINTFRERHANAVGLGEVYVDLGVRLEIGTTAVLGLLPRTRAEAISEDAVSPGQGMVQMADPDFSYVQQRDAICRNQDLLTPFLGDGQTLTRIEGGAMPLFVPSEALTTEHEETFRRLRTAGERVEKRKELERALLGKTSELSFLSPYFEPSSQPQEPSARKTVPVKVVGFLPGGNGAWLFGQDFMADEYAMPCEIAEQDPETRDIFGAARSVYPSFGTTDQRNEFVAKSGSDAFIYADVVESNKAHLETFRRAFDIAVVVMLFLMAIPMAATLSKILADSQRETGVFRAIGARNRQIISIYGLYSLQVVVGSFLLALAGSVGACVWLTARFGPDLELALADLAGHESEIDFLAFNGQQLTIIFLALLIGSVVGAAFPLFRSLRRNPIESLRDE